MKLNRLAFTFLFTVLACLMPLAVIAQQSESYTKGVGKASATIVTETYQYKFTEADFADAPSWKDGDG